MDKPVLFHVCMLYFAALYIYYLVFSGLRSSPVQISRSTWTYSRSSTPCKTILEVIDTRLIKYTPIYINWTDSWTQRNAHFRRVSGSFTG